MRLLLTIALLSLLFFQSLFSQESNENMAILNLKIMPLSILDYTPRYRFGAEFISKKKLGFSIDLGIGNYFLNKINLNHVCGNDYAFYEIRPEIKYILRRSEHNYSYCAIELFYLNMSTSFQNGHYEIENSGIETFFDHAQFSKHKYGFHIKGGVNLIEFKRLNIDIYGGIGFAKRAITYTDVINPVDGLDRIFVEWVPQNYLFEGESFILHFTAGLKIGYTLWKN